MDGKIKILFIAANPRDTSRLSLDEEIREILKRIRGAEQGSQFVVQAELALRPQELPAALMRHQPDIVHFSGHGTADGALCLVSDASQRTQEVSAEQLVDIFRPLGRDIRCVVLSACYSAIQAKAIASCVPCVVGMSRAVKDKTAVAFAAGFYEALAFGKSVQTAFELGRVQMGLLPVSAPGAVGLANQQQRSLRQEEVADSAPSENEIPQLLMREGTDPAKLVLAKVTRPNPWAAASTDGRDSVAPGAGMNIKVGDITMGGRNNKASIGQTATAGSRTSVDLGNQNLEVGNISISGTDNVTNISQNKVYGSAGTAEPSRSPVEQARLLVQNLADAFSESSLSPFQKKAVVLLVSEISEQLCNPTPDPASFVEPMDDLRRKLIALPGLTEQLDRLAALIRQLPA